MGKLISLVGGFVFLTGSLFSQELKFSTNPYEFIPQGPRGPRVYPFDLTGDGITDTYWWDKNNDKEPTEDEIFADFNQDGIPDCTWKRLIDWYNNEEQKKLMKSLI